MNLAVLRKFIREQIARNFHSLDDTAYTFDDFQDYDIEINTDGKSERFYLNVFFQNEKITPTASYATQEEAVHASRTIVDSHRVKIMNSNS